MDPREPTRVTFQGQPITLERDNWAQFKDAVRILCLKMGEAGMALYTGKEQRVKPGTKTTDAAGTEAAKKGKKKQSETSEHTENAESKEQDLIENAGADLRDKEYEEYTAKKRRLIGIIIEAIGQDIRDKLDAQTKLEELIIQGDVINFFKLVEKVVEGSGSATIYQLLTRFFRLSMKEEDTWAGYIREWKDLVASVKRQGSAEEILEAIFQTHLVMTVDQEKFKEILTTIYASTVWPATHKLMDTFAAYATNREVIAMVQNHTPDGRIGAFTSKARGIQPVQTQRTTDLRKRDDRTCYNCGEIGHLVANCPRPPTRCGICGRHHLTKLCPKTSELKRVGQQPHRETRGIEQNREQKKKSTNTQKRNRFSNYAIRFGHEDGSDDDYDPSEEDEEQLENEEITEDKGQPSRVWYIGDEESDGGTTTHDLEGTSYNIITKEQLEDTEFIMDTGCRRYNICKTREIIDDIRKTKAQIVGISGTPIPADGIGQLPFVGETLLCSGADANLISVPHLIEQYPGTWVKTTASTMELITASGRVLLTATARGGFWRCRYQDLKDAAKKMDAHIGLTTRIETVHQTEETNEEDEADTGDDNSLIALPPPVKDPNTQWPNTPTPVPSPAPATTHLTSEERTRAESAWKLCALLGHPGWQKIIRDLDNNCYPDTHLTSADVTNGMKLYGPCPACIEAKMRPPGEPTSLSPPAQSIGERLHADILPLRHKSLGGHTFALAAVDEKTGYVSLIALPSKHTQALTIAFRNIISFYQSYGHTVREINTDSENNLKALETVFGLMGIHHNALPPDMHQKRMERYVQTIKRRRDAMLATLPYEIPTLLEAEALVQAVTLLNQTSNKASSPSTPCQLVTGRRPFIPEFYFGQVGMFFVRKRDNPHVRAEWGIFLGYNGHRKSLRAYIPLSQAVYARRKFHPYHTVPSEWNLAPRLRRQSHVSTAKPPILPAATTPWPNLPTLTPSPKVAMAPPPPAQQPPTPQPPPHPPPPSPPQPLPQPLPQPPPQPPVPTAPTNPHRPPSPSQAQEGELDILREARKGTEGENDLEPARRNPRRSSTQNRGWVEGRHKSYFTVPNQEDELLVRTYRVSFRAAMRMKENTPGIMEAASAEIHNMLSNKVLSPVPQDYLQDGEKPIPAHMFFNFKTKADGSFDKIKARIVANGNLQDEDDIGETFAPTVNTISVLTILSLVASSDLILSSHDIKAAFLLTPVPSDVRLFISIKGDLTELWISVHPEHSKFRTQKGELIFRLTQYIYGLAESPHKFHEYLVEKLKLAGYQRLRSDPCVFISDKANSAGKRSYVAVHVDDMLHAGADERAVRDFETAMKEFCELSSQKDGHISYLGLNIQHDRKNKMITVDQSGYAKALIEKSGLPPSVRKPPSTPSNADLVCEDTDPQPLTRQEHKDYRSLVMAIMFLARMTRPDLLFTTTVLATHCNNPTVKNMQEVYRILRYIQGTAHYGLTFRGETAHRLQPIIYADSSHGLHPNGHGHGGILIRLGEMAPILSRSFKLTMVTRSSAESELIALDEASTYAVWLRLILHELKVYGHRAPPSVIIYQDNQSTIKMSTQETYNFKRSKHLLVRENYVRERIMTGDIEIRYMPTRDMLADILTKPVEKGTLERSLDQMSLKLNPDSDS